MATIDNLNTSISEMSSSELLERILALRKSRRVVKKVTKAKPKPKKPKAFELRLTNKNSTPEEKASVIKDYGNIDIDKLIKDLEGM